MPDFKTEKKKKKSARKLGEKSYIVSLLTRENGRFLGVYQKKIPPETGTFVAARWQARLAEQLGTFYLEEICPFSIRFLDDAKRLACLASLCALVDDLLPERQAFPDLYDAVFAFLDILETPDFMKHYVRLEMIFLSAVGFGLDTSCCAGGGDKNDLAYISPRTGRAVSREKGLPYHDKLLPLPRFIWQNAPATDADIRNGLNLTGFFLNTYALKHRLPKVREQLL